MTGAGIYLDHAATTPVDPHVLNAMLPFFSERYGNPSSIHAVGRDARAALDWSRQTVAGLLGGSADDFIMTSGATEANNLAVKGVLWHRLRERLVHRPHAIVSAIEHPSVLQSVEALQAHGVEISVVRPRTDGVICVADIAAAVRAETHLISIMLANNEIGTIQPVREITALTKGRGIVVHTDAVQAVGAIPVDVEALGVDLLTLSAHKFYGPKGVGALYVRPGTPMVWQQHGGGQEDTRRGGTENVALIVGMAAALALACHEMSERSVRMMALRDRLIDGLLERVPRSRLNGHATLRLPNNANVSFEEVDGEAMLLSLDLLGIAASSGSACSTGSTEPSHVLRAIGLDDEMAQGSLRLTVGKDTTIEEVERAVEAVDATVGRMRALAVEGGDLAG